MSALAQHWLWAKFRLVDQWPSGIGDQTPEDTATSLESASEPTSRKLSDEITVEKLFITGSIAHNAKRWYLSYSEGNFEVSSHAGTTRCTDGGEILHGLCQISPHRCNDKAIAGPPN